MKLKIGVAGCIHGKLEDLYKAVRYAKDTKGIDLDLVICCGDFQSIRDEQDLKSLAVPHKYRHMLDFHKYYSGELKAEVLTIFIGGNHESSSYLSELPYGGWVAPNIFYMGRANVVNFKGLRIAGLSGIYKPYNYLRGYFENDLFNSDQMRSVYHVRNLDVFRLKQLAQPIDVLLTHDWPRGIEHFGNKEELFAKKRFLFLDSQQGELGSLPSYELLAMLKPKYWFAAHMHVKFAALVPHENESFTKFLALDKCLRGRSFFQILEMDSPLLDIDNVNCEAKLCYDLEWLTVLKKTNHLVKISKEKHYMPTPLSGEVYNFTPCEQEMVALREALNNDLTVREKFCQRSTNGKVSLSINSQTTEFCARFEVCDLVKLLLEQLETTSSDYSAPNASSTSSGLAVISSETLPSAQAEVRDLPSSENPDEIPLDDI
ncbi:Lariat debranching enzyme [Trichinella pseudospiralis]|uniref:Lariat debranching enzyme n=1 Tax=Trichinella pseudospiralis TaxID=6337 RepID=A0A0V1HJA5_TRIPS|nr:Lariat debranching enzyme [Trichinella pseudospiralis]KRZ41597.1 Lariat debranching enzyme [Trichinella pseudospiralis]